MLESLWEEQITPPAGSCLRFASPSYLLRKAGRPLVSQTAHLHPESVQGKTHSVSPRPTHLSAQKTSWWWLSSPALPHKRKQLRWEQQHYLGTMSQHWSLFSPCLPSNSNHRLVLQHKASISCTLLGTEVEQGTSLMTYGACPTPWSIWTSAVCILTKAIACRCQFHGYTVKTTSASQILQDLFYSWREKANWQTSKTSFRRGRGKLWSFSVSYVSGLSQRNIARLKNNHRFAWLPLLPGQLPLTMAIDRMLVASE